MCSFEIQIPHNKVRKNCNSWSGRTWMRGKPPLEKVYKMISGEWFAPRIWRCHGISLPTRSPNFPHISCTVLNNVMQSLITILRHTRATTFSQKSEATCEFLHEKTSIRNHIVRYCTHDYTSAQCCMISTITTCRNNHLWL